MDSETALTMIAVVVIIAISTWACGMGGFVVDKLELDDTARASLNARAAEAEAERVAAQADLAEAQAQIEREKGEAQAKRIQAQAEAELYSAAAASVRKDSRLVAWYAVRRDVVLLFALFPLEVGGGIAAGVYLAKKKQTGG